MHQENIETVQAVNEMKSEMASVTKLRVLWLAVTPSLYGDNNIGHNGGGWIASLERLIRTASNIELGIAFLHPHDGGKVTRNGVTYYPLPIYNTKWKERLHRYKFASEENNEVAACLKVIDDFKPDVIHVFGTEWSFGLIAEHTKTPVIIHIQGLAGPYLNAYFPPGHSFVDFLVRDGINFKRKTHRILEYFHFKHRAKREARILRSCRFFMGRTEWDKKLVEMLSPNSEYFYCSEAVRPSFIAASGSWMIKDRARKILMSSISPPLYKGADVLLKTAHVLKTSGLDFEWQVFGVSNLDFGVSKTKICASDVNIKIMGAVSESQIKDALLDADLFVHPAYIENSPNSICEAQLVGIPVISTNVGGISSLLTDKKTGWLVPANDPYSMGATILSAFKSSQASLLNISQNATEIARSRHSPEQILSDLQSIYSKLRNHENNRVSAAQ